MDIMELGAIGEFTSGLAVIGSLLFVGLQVRQSNRLSRAEGLREYVREFNQTVLTPIKDPATASVLRRGLNHFEELSKDEQLVGHAQFMKILMLGQADFVLRREGLVREDFADLMAGLDIGMLRSPGGAQWWQMSKDAFLADYAAQIDREIAAGEIPAMSETFPFWGADQEGA